MISTDELPAGRRCVFVMGTGPMRKGFWNNVFGTKRSHSFFGVMTFWVVMHGSLTFGEMVWTELPPLPNSVGVAGAYVGQYEGALIVAGGANFPTSPGEDIWSVSKKWHDQAYILQREGTNDQWHGGFQLDDPVAYGAVVSTPMGVVCMGGNNSDRVLSDVFLLQWDGHQLTQTDLPDLPKPCAYGAAAQIGNTVYLAGGVSGDGLQSAMTNFWSLDLSLLNVGGPQFCWKELPAWPGCERAFNLTAVQHNGFESCVYVMSGRRQDGDGVDVLRDVYEYSPSQNKWRRRTDMPVPMMAGTCAAVGQSHVIVLSGADGSLIGREEELKNSHPGFPRKAWMYHTITDTWVDAGEIPCNQVTTPAAPFEDGLALVSGEIRPRIRTPKAWRIQFEPQQKASFGAVDFTVLGTYLLLMMGIGVFFMRRNRSTDDYFRGGQNIPWWAAGCSIFATMLSSITFMAIPAKAYAQNWIFLLGNFMIVAVAPLAVYLALPFFRRIDATSAYEYLEKRFSRSVRLLASGFFSVFHIFRMGIVLSLAGLALAILTPLTPGQSVLIMGGLSILYCALGGLEAVVWTDTVQTFILLGGALLCFFLIIFRLDGGLAELVNIGVSDGKFHFSDFDFSANSYAVMAIWVVIVGGLGQNISSYTADQSIVQRYMSTSSQKTAARSIWTNAFLAIPASVLFFFMGTALYAFYKVNPELLDPVMNTDQVFPLFISTQVPVGIAGLIVAGIFAAAQSTVSTSMNSTATTLVTDFLRPFSVFKDDRGYLYAGRLLTFGLGAAGTALGLLFVNPEITSLFDAFLTMIGLFMGILGGLFCLGMLTRRANAAGALIGLICAIVLLWILKTFTDVHWYLYAAIGVGSCFIFGYIFSLFTPAGSLNLEGLTVYALALRTGSSAGKNNMKKSEQRAQ